VAASDLTREDLVRMIVEWSKSDDAEAVLMELKVRIDRQAAHHPRQPDDKNNRREKTETAKAYTSTPETEIDSQR
jgi:hypothetical protein